MHHRNRDQPQGQCQTVGKIAVEHTTVGLPMIDSGKLYYLRKQKEEIKLKKGGRFMGNNDN